MNSFFLGLNSFPPGLNSLQYCAAYNTWLSKTIEDCTTHSYNKRCGRARYCMYCTTLCFAIRTMLNCTLESWRCCAALQEASGGAMLQFWTVPCNIRLHKQFNAACNTLGASQSAQRDLHDLLDHALLRKIVQYNAILYTVLYCTVRDSNGLSREVFTPGLPLSRFPEQAESQPIPTSNEPAHHPEPFQPAQSGQPAQP